MNISKFLNYFLIIKHINASASERVARDLGPRGGTHAAAPRSTVGPTHQPPRESTVADGRAAHSGHDDAAGGR